MTATTPLDAPLNAVIERHPDGHILRVPNDRNAGLDLLRSLACLLVVAFHLRTVLGVDFGPLNSFVRGGDTGVFVFFALSGYLLYRPVLRGEVNLEHYTIKRSARILPGYLVALVSLAALTGSRLPVDNPLPYLAMTAPYDIELRGFLGNAWTLSAELIFYVALPFIARWAAGAEIPRLSILALASVVASVFYGAVDQTGIEWVVGSFPFVLYAFVPGMLLAVIEVRDPRLFRQFSAPWVAVVGIGAVVVQTQLHNFPVALAAAIGTPLLIGWLASVRVPFARALGFAGGASYAMYLWHKDLFFTFGVFGLVIAAVGAAASWALVERPVLEFAHGVVARRRTPRLADIPVPAAST
jgi:peptidoglycan/LPS O-acetylase OafA/YrhL